MSIEIVTIGDEILAGKTPNTNTTFLSKELSLAGHRIARHTTLPDDPQLLEQGLKEALQRSSLVIATGGLGPTIDDHTRTIAAKLFHSPFHYDEAVAADLERRFGKTLASLKDQATIPTKAKLLVNRIGTAPGFYFSSEGKGLVLMPGVPVEMERMFKDQVLPLLSTPEQTHLDMLHFFALIENQVDPLLRELKSAHPELDLGIYPGHGVLTVTLKAPSEKLLRFAREKIEAAFSAYLFSSLTGRVEDVIQQQMIARKKTLALAESCTGGMVAQHLTAIPGASEYFLGSIVSYSNSLKQGLLHVSEKTLKEHGAVSQEAVKEMLSGIFKATPADFGIAVSGIAGPSGGTAAKPVGTVWAAMGERGKSPHVFTFQARGNRQTIILTTTNILLGTFQKQFL